MTLAAAIEAELPNLRAEAEARMTSRVTVHRQTGKGAQNETTGAHAASWSTPYTNLPFRLAGAYHGDASSRAVVVGGVEVQVSIRTGNFPHDTDDLRDGDWVEVTAGENASSVYRIVEADAQDQATARRVPLVADRPQTGWS